MLSFKILSEFSFLEASCHFKGFYQIITYGLTILSIQPNSNAK